MFTFAARQASHTARASSSAIAPRAKVRSAVPIADVQRTCACADPSKGSTTAIAGYDDVVAAARMPRTPAVQRQTGDTPPGRVGGPRTTDANSTAAIAGYDDVVAAARVPGRLSISQVGDPLEREADDIADRVMRTAESAPVAGRSRAQLSRQCAACDEAGQAPPDLMTNLGSGRPLDDSTRSFMEPRFNRDFGNVRIHDGAAADAAARSIDARAFTVGSEVVFRTGAHQPDATAGRHLLAHELTHVVQQSDAGAARSAMAYRAGGAGAAPYIKKITVHLTPPQSADLEWHGTPPPTAPGSDHFVVSTGKGYSDPDDPAGTCTRTCCSDPLTQCAPPYNQPGNVGACCTYYGSSFWTGTPLTEHNGWAWWTPIQPYYSSRGIALHAHPEVTGEPIGHGCVRMDEPNAKRIHDHAKGRHTNVTTDGRAAPVLCDDSGRCSGSGKDKRTGDRATDAGGGGSEGGTRLAAGKAAVPGREGELS
jgi:uncharacterized protein DUF4157/L,D-transpeptidase-like protein